VTGAALFPDWTPQYFLDYVLNNTGLIILPNYRLLPEATGSDALEDLNDFWTWVRNDLAFFLENSGTDVKADIDRVAVFGESAGGWCAVQSAFLQPPGTMRAVLTTFPFIDIECDYFAKADPTNSPLGAPELPRAVLDGHVAAIKPGAVVTEVMPMARMELAVSMTQQGRFPEFMGPADEVYPFRILESGRVKQIPLILIGHATEDTVVPCDGSVKFVRLLREQFGDDAAFLHTEPGEHGFDAECTLQEPWLKSFMAKTSAKWLA
jgi:acetyl esterase/lipase